MDPYPQLDTCVGSTTPCHREAIWDASKKLASNLRSVCTGCDAVFQFAGGSSSGLAAFIQGTSTNGKPPEFYDGTHSNAYMDEAMCQSGRTCAFKHETVANYMKRNTSLAITRPFGPNLLVFWEPSTICLEPAGTSKGMWNQAQLFHESLHGYTGFDDIFFLDHFYNNEKLASIYISYWFADNISFLQGAAVTCGN
jgi:hypothetical protein